MRKKTCYFCFIKDLLTYSMKMDINFKKKSKKQFHIKHHLAICFVEHFKAKTHFLVIKLQF